jgi:hypothetical protein
MSLVAAGWTNELGYFFRHHIPTVSDAPIPMFAMETFLLGKAVGTRN